MENESSPTYRVVSFSYNGEEEDMAVVKNQTPEMYQASVRALFNIPRAEAIFCMNENGGELNLGATSSLPPIIIVLAVAPADGVEGSINVGESNQMPDGVEGPVVKIHEHAEEIKLPVIGIPAPEPIANDELAVVKKPNEHAIKPEVYVEEVEEAKERKAATTVAIIGHVSVGKSTICGKIMETKGKVDPHVMDQNVKEAKQNKRATCYLAYVMDTSLEEREHGSTFEVGRATFTTTTKKFVLYDTPGHNDFIANMITGAAMADVGILVISAKRGDFESGLSVCGKTLDHLLLARAVGIQKMIIAVNKMDEQSVQWSQERFEQIKKDMAPFVSRCGLKAGRDVFWIPLSGFTGENIESKVDSKVCSWYEGPTLMELFEAIQVTKPENNETLRMTVFENYKNEDANIFGKIQCGKIEVGSQLVVMPGNLVAEVATIQNADYEPMESANAGEEVRLKLKGLYDTSTIYRGCLICNEDNPCPVFKVFIAEVKIVGLPKHKPILSAGYECVLHLHTFMDKCKILGLFQAKSNASLRFARQKDFVRCVIGTDAPIAAEKFVAGSKGRNNALGRLVLRDEGLTIAVGCIVKYQPVE